MGVIILSVMSDNAMPTKLIVGYKDNIDTSAQRITDKPTPIYKSVTITVRSLGTGTYIALGDEDEQSWKFTGVNQSLDVDFVNDLSKLVVVTDAGNTGYLQWIGG